MQPSQAPSRPVRAGDRWRGPLVSGGLRARRRPAGRAQEVDSAPFVPRLESSSTGRSTGRATAVRIIPSMPRSSTRPTSRASRSVTPPSRRRSAARTRASRTRPPSALRGLGITAVELLPVHQFVDDGFLIDRGLRNYWGYNSVGYLRAAAGTQHARDPGGGHRVQDDGQDAACRGHRGDPRRRLQPHGRRATSTGPRSRSAASTTPPTTGSAR